MKNNSTTPPQKPASRPLQPQEATIQPESGIAPIDQEQAAASQEFAPKSLIRTRVKQKLMVQHYRETLGHVTKAAEKTGISRRTHELWMARNPEYRKRIGEVDEELLDEDENTVKLISMDVKANPALALKAATFRLLQKGKARGYTQPGVAVQVNTRVNTDAGPRMSFSQFDSVVQAVLEQKYGKKEKNPNEEKRRDNHGQ